MRASNTSKRMIVTTVVMVMLMGTELAYGMRVFKPLDMGGNQITNVRVPVAAHEAAVKGDVDAYAAGQYPYPLPWSGGVMVGDTNPPGAAFLSNVQTRLHPCPLNSFHVGPSVGNTGSIFRGAVLLADGRVVCVPSANAGGKLGIYNPHDNSFATIPSPWSYAGGVLLPNGHVCLIPDSETNIAVYNPYSNTVTLGPQHGEGSGAFVGGVLLHDGRVLLVPHRAQRVGLFNPSTGIYTPGPQHNQTGTFNFWGGTLLPNGKVVLCPRDSPRIMVYNPASNVLEQGPAHGRTNVAFRGSVLLTDGRVALIPLGGGPLGIYDPQGNNLIDGPDTGSGEYAGGTLLPDGRVLLIPQNKTQIAVCDIVRNHVLFVETGRTNRFAGGVLLRDGRVIMMPWGDSVIGIYYSGGTFDSGLCLSPYYNKL